MQNLVKVSLKSKIRNIIFSIDNVFVNLLNTPLYFV
eukprot:UN15290